MQKNIVYMLSSLCVVSVLLYGSLMIYSKENLVCYKNRAKKIDGLTLGSKQRGFNPGLGRSRTVFYNRIGKCGSRSLLNIARRLSEVNKFNMSSSDNFGNIHPLHHEKITEILKISKFFPPMFYDRHIHYIDFEKYGFKKPIYINMIRDPVDRFASHYNFEKYGGVDRKENDLLKHTPEINECILKTHKRCNMTYHRFYIGQYFCGFEKNCNTISAESVEQAKKNIDDGYDVIITLEEFENSLLLLEKMIPEYFKGAMVAWKGSSTTKNATKTKTKEILTEESKKLLRNHYLKADYEVYHHAKEKFEKLKKKYGIDK